MKNFFRVVRIALRRRFTFAAAILCSLCVAVLWGSNLGLVKPIVEIVFSGKTPHTWVRAQEATAEKNIAQLQAEIVEHEAKLASLGVDSGIAGEHRAAIDSRKVTLEAEQEALSATRYMKPLVLRYLPDNSFQALAIAVGLLMLATIVKDGFLITNMLLVEKLSQTALFDLRKELFRRTLRLELAKFGDDRTSNLLSRFTNDANYVYAGINVLLGKVVLEPLKMLACLAGAAFICWRLLAVSLIFAPLAVFIVGRLAHSLKRANRRAMEEMSQLYNVISESFSGIHAVKAFGMERFERRRFHLGSKSYYFKSLRIVIYNALARSSSEVLGMAIICLAIMAGGYLVLNQQTHLLGVKIMDRPLSLGSLMAFFALLAGVSDPARKLSEVLNYIQKALAASDRIYEMMDREADIKDPAQPKSLATASPDIVFDNVSFSYRPGHAILRNIDLRIPFGETVAIVGPNGCGKSTLVNLLPRFYDANSGEVRLGGIAVPDLRLKDLRRNFGFVAQQPMLFDDTVFANIRYGSPEATEAEVVEAATKAHAHRFILDRLEHGYQTRVGERGGKLSGGQRQRLLLARAILRDPKVLILDEATSQIDLESEQLIHKVLEQFVRGRTTLMITHRMSSLALADRIVVMDQGEIIDVGTYDELSSRCELFARLCHLGYRQTA
jgi:subfamily B ATP-binding cassette protein MsbA